MRGGLIPRSRSSRPLPRSKSVSAPLDISCRRLSAIDVRYALRGSKPLLLAQRVCCSMTEGMGDVIGRYLRPGDARARYQQGETTCVHEPRVAVTACRRGLAAVAQPALPNGIYRITQRIAITSELKTDSMVCFER